MFPITSFRIIYRASVKWSENADSRLGAALAYYALFSIAPLLLIATHIAGEIFGEEAAKGEMKLRLHDIMGKESAAAVEKLVENAAVSTGNTVWTSAMSIAVLIFGALGAFLHVRSALGMIWNLKPPSGNSWLSLLWDYLFAFLMVLIIAVFLLASVAFSVVVPFLQRHLHDGAYWQWVELGSSFVFLTLLFAVSYRVLSGGRLTWGYVLYGSIMTSILFSLGKTALSYYLVYSGTASAYGAAGSIVVFLVWVYYSSQIIFFGAELIQARRTREEWM